MAMRYERLKKEVVRAVAMSLMGAFFVLLDHCSIEALAFSGQSASASPGVMSAHATTTSHGRNCHHVPRNHSDREDSDRDCSQIDCCTAVRAEIQVHGTFLNSNDQKNLQSIQDLTSILPIIHRDKRPQLARVNDVGPPGFFPQIYFYESAFASQAPPQA
jgi:hypothetical protein